MTDSLQPEQRAEPLTAEELERTRTEYTNCRDLQASGVIDAMEAAPFTDWVGRVLATIDARDAALRQAEDERDRLLNALWAMVQQSVDDENEGLTEDDPDWETAATFLTPNTVSWTPTVKGDVLRQVQSALREGR